MKRQQRKVTYLYRIPKNYVKRFKKRKSKKKFISYVQNSIWITATLVSGALCAWQLILNLQKFIEQPTATYVSVKHFKTNAFPGFTLCPAGYDHAYEFGGEFGKRCAESDVCRDLSEFDKKRISFAKMNFSLMDLWQPKTNMTVVGQKRCIYAVEADKCNSEDWLKRNRTDTTAGSCQTYHTDVQWFYVGKPWVFWIEIANISHLSNIPFMLDFYATGETTNVLFVGKTYIHRLFYNQMSLLPTTFEYLNTSRNPCSTREQQIRCINRQTNQKLDIPHANCRWPFVNSTLPLCDSMLQVTKVSEKIKEIQNNFDKGCIRSCSMTTFSLVEIKQKHNFNTTLTYIAFTLQSNTRQFVSEFFSYQFPTFVSDIGSGIGLFLGISLLSSLRVFVRVLDRFL